MPRHDLIYDVDLRENLRRNPLLQQCSVNPLEGLPSLPLRNLLPKFGSKEIAQEKSTTLLLYCQAPGFVVGDIVGHACDASCVAEACQQPAVTQQVFGGLEQMQASEEQHDQLGHYCAFLLVAWYAPGEPLPVDPDHLLLHLLGAVLTGQARKHCLYNDRQEMSALGEHLAIQVKQRGMLQFLGSVIGIVPHLAQDIEGECKRRACQKIQQTRRRWREMCADDFLQHLLCLAVCFAAKHAGSTQQTFNKLGVRIFLHVFLLRWDVVLRIERHILQRRGPQFNQPGIASTTYADLLEQWLCDIIKAHSPPDRRPGLW